MRSGNSSGEVFEKMRMKDLPIEERPYEKLEKYGEDKLSDSELLAIIIKTGTKDERVVELAQRILGCNDKHQGLSNLYNMSFEELTSIKGIGRVKAIQLKAVIELSKRMSKQKNMLSHSASSTKSVVSVYMEEMRYHKQEVCKVILVDKSNQIMFDKNVTVGNINSSVVDPREVFKPALEKGARGVILMHNHPSGDTTPSRADVDITKRLKDSGVLLGVNFIDHIIIGNGDYLSMKEYGII